MTALAVSAAAAGGVRGPTGAWGLNGNAGTVPGSNYLGTSDEKALELKVNGKRALRLQPAGGETPNVIGGFAGNSVSGGIFGATIGGGGLLLNANSATGNYAFVGGRLKNKAAQAATVAGGQGNTAGALDSAVGGGLSNRATGLAAVVAGGESNTASGLYSAIGGGYTNAAGGSWSAVPGGYKNTASGAKSFAGGICARATKVSAFVWNSGDGCVPLTSYADNTFSVRATGGIWLGDTCACAFNGSDHLIDTSSGAYLSDAGSWTNFSDRRAKRGFRRMDGGAIVKRLARMPVSSWSYKAERRSVRHIGPTAQDFYAAFGLGLDDRHIATVDEGGVALAAIQGLYRQNLGLQARIARLEQKVSRLSRP